jgi:hypothetical protein
MNNVWQKSCNFPHIEVYKFHAWRQVGGGGTGNLTLPAAELARESFALVSGVVTTKNGYTGRRYRQEIQQKKYQKAIPISKEHKGSKKMRTVPS